jgi:cytokinin dehydrogenase
MEHQVARRAFVTGVATGALVVGFDPVARRWVAQASTGASLGNVPSLDGRLLTDPTARSQAADDFGHIVHRSPRAVLLPGSVSDVATMVRYCHARGIAVAARGQGHATYGQAQAAGGLIIDMSTLREVRVRDGEVIAMAGARWSDVLHATLPHGLTPPVLTDYLELSVGGTLSAGGVGGAAHRHGAQVDNLTELEVVTGTGERVVCSPSRRADLFHAVRAGLGQCGVIVRATVRLSPAPERVRRYQLHYPTAAALMADQRRVVRDGRFAYVEGQVQPAADGSADWRPLLEAVAFFAGSVPPDDAALLGDLSHERGTEEIEDLSYFDFLDRMAPAVAYLRSIGEWYHPHPWWNTFLPDAAADSFVSTTLAHLAPADIGPSGVLLLYPLRRALLRTPLLRTPDSHLVFLFAVLRTASPVAGVPGPAEMVAANRALYERVRALGGTQYPVGSIPMTPNDWRAHFGSAWPAFAAAKRRYDPRRILAPGQGVFG